MAALFFTFYESDSFRKEPHRPHQRRIFIRISLQDFIGRDESGEGAIGFGECVFGERIIGLHDATTQDYDIWFEYNTEIPDGSLQFKTEALDSDAMYDDIGSVLKIKQLQTEKRELLQSLEMYYKVFFLGETIEDDGEMIGKES